MSSGPRTSLPRALAGAALFFCAAPERLAARADDLRDELVLVGGAVVRGRIVYEDGERFIVRVEGAERVVPRPEVASSQSVFRAQGDVLKQYAALSTNDAASLLSLAEQCRTRSLPHEEELFYWLTLNADEANQVAHARLGHVDKGGRWLVPMRGGAKSFEELLKVRETWGKAWELRSEHYAVRSDAGLESAISVLFELEQFYRVFFTLFQTPLKLREVLEPMSVELFRDRARFPRVSTHVDSSFDPTMRVLHTYVQGGAPTALFHEATRQLLYQLGGGSERALGEIPPWLAIGWAEYMEGVLTRPAARRTGLLQHQAKRLLDAHRLLFERTPKSKRYGLHRVLNFGLSDFDASSGQGLKYAQSYLLFHYLMHAQGDTFQARFLAYLALAFGGQGQASTFRDHFDSDALERDLPYYQGR